MTIVLNNLTKAYRNGPTALDALTLTIKPGITGLLGPNGAGKTTLMRILATLMAPTSGSVEIAGMDALDPGHGWEIKRMLGYLPQEIALYGNLSAREFLMMVAELKGISAASERKRQVDEALEMTGLADVAKRRLKTFSGGMKRRAGIAQALLGDPKILIVDEPTAGLDPQERSRFRTLLVRLAANRLVLLSSHILDDIAQTCQAIGVLNRGRLTFQGTTRELQAEAQNRAWEFEAQVFTPQDGQILVTMLASDGGFRYRVLAAEPPVAGATLTPPTLEEGYLWHMRPR